jgi:hypothetical protein
VSPLALEIWSGGQTGVDRAALDVALELGLPIAGWIPRGRAAEDGRVPMKYRDLREAASPDYAVRTHLNVNTTDATLVLSWGPATGGTKDTVVIARRLGRPLLELDLASADVELAAGRICEWLNGLARPGGRPLRVNVAGPRDSQAPGAYAQATEILRRGLLSLAVV